MTALAISLLGRFSPGAMQFLGTVAHGAIPGTSQSRARGGFFEYVYKRLSVILCRYNSRMITAAAGLQTATTGRGWIRGACRPCPDLHLYGPSPVHRNGG